jgi:hypothetical protein
LVGARLGDADALMCADVTIKVLEEPTSRDFLTLEEAKKRLGLPTSGSTPEADELLQIQISDASAIIARLCNRQFAKTTVAETWRGNDHDAIYLRLWPVWDEDMFGIGSGLGIWPSPPLPPGSFDLENYSGKLRAPLSDPITITYAGGYLLPDECPNDLKNACVLIMRSSRSEAQRESVEGIRMIAHKESRVIFFDPNTQKTATATAASGGYGYGPAVDSILPRYIRRWM